MKLSKQLPLILIFISLIALATGYFYGLRLNDITGIFSSSKSGTSNIQDSTNQHITSDTLANVPTKKSKNKKHEATSSKQETEVDEFEPLPIDSFISIDLHARNCPISEEASIELLANYLQRKAITDLEKARSIYIWLTKNVSYDDIGFNSGIYGDLSAEGVLKSRKAVCEGFSNLFLALGKQMKLEIQKVSGYAKGYGYRVGETYSKPNHAWNIIKINGQWKIFDATWGEGNGVNVNGKLVSTKKFNNFWFNVNPFIAIFSHFPENRSKQNIKPELDLNSYSKFPRIEESYFDLGFDPTTTYNSLYRNRNLTFPTSYSSGTYVKANSAPMFGILHLKKLYSFEFYAPRAISIAVINSKNEWTYFDRKKGVFSLPYTPEIAGKLEISIKYDKGGDNYHTFMEYTVK